MVHATAQPPHLEFRLASLRVAVGSLCVAIGALMLMAPHEFESPAFASLRPYLTPVGLLWAVSGLGLWCVAILSPRRVWVLLVHAMAGAALMALGAALASTGAWNGSALWGVVGLGVMAAGAQARGRDAEEGEDLLPLVLGMASLANGLVVLLIPSVAASPIYDTIRPILPLFGAGLALGGLALMAGSLLRRRLAWLALAGRLVTAVTFLAFLSQNSLPLRIWTGVIFYGGFGVGLLLLPWWSGWVTSRVATSTLRTQMTLALALASTVPLIAVVSFSAARLEEGAESAALARQRNRAEILAVAVHENMAENQATMAGLAAIPGLLELPVARQMELLSAFGQTNRDISGIASFTDHGEPIARSDQRAPLSVADMQHFQMARATGQPTVAVHQLKTRGTPVIVVGAPVMREGRFTGFVGGMLEINHLAEALARLSGPEDPATYVVDPGGHAIAHPERRIASTFEDLSKVPPVAAFLASEAGGALTYRGAAGEMIAGYAPVERLGWGVIVETPASEVLAPVRSAREAAFWVLLAAVGVAAVLGLVAARWLARPLSRIAEAATALTEDGGMHHPMPASGISEIHELAVAFETMRVRLAMRAAERERLLKAEQAARVQAEEAVRARDQFLSIAAHELRTPITSIKGYAQLAERLRARGTLDTAGAEKLFGNIGASVERLTSLVDDLLDVARLQSGRYQIRREPIDLTALVQEVAERCRPSLDERHELRVVGMDEPCSMEADSARLYQVLTNLLDNAIKYSPEGGTIVVGLRRRGKEVELTVEDEGIGLPEGSEELIFEPFGRAENAAESYLPGMGLGLYICAQIVEAHGGTVSAHSEGEGRGTTMTVRLPVSGAARLEAAAEKSRNGKVAARVVSGSAVADGSATER